MHFKQNNNKDQFYLQGLRSFKSSLPVYLKKILNKKGHLYSEIIKKWYFLVENKISKISFPKSIQFKNGKKDGILVLSVQRGEEIEVEYSKNKIISKINSYFGYEVINQIKLETFTPSNKKKLNAVNNLNLNPKKFENQIGNINNQNIKNALYKLLDEIKK